MNFLSPSYSIVEHAPSRVYYGHSSFVTGVRVSQGNDKVISIGGKRTFDSVPVNNCFVVLYRFIFCFYISFIRT